MNTSVGFVGSTWDFDKLTPGASVYEFPPDVLVIPALRTILGSDRLFTTIKMVVGFTASASSVTFAASGNTVMRTSGSFIADAFRVHQYVTITNTASNNQVRVRIVALTATVMTLSGGVADEVEVAATITCVDGSYGIRPAGNPWAFVRRLKFHGGGVAPDASDALVHYAFETSGFLGAGGAGPGLIIHECEILNARDTAIHGRNSALKIFDCRIATFGKWGIWSEGCSECVLEGTTLTGEGNPTVEGLILFEGSGAGSNTRSGEVLTNGGLWRCFRNFGGVAPIGIHWNGVGGGNFDQGSCEGCSVTTYLFTYSTGITGIGNRSNAGEYARFHNCKTITFGGTGVTTNTVQYTGDSRGIDCNPRAESFTAFVAIEHHFGTRPFIAIRDPMDGHWISKANVAPSDGYWEKSAEMDRYDKEVGQPDYWTCALNGNPNGGTGIWLAGPLRQ